ncbi:MAG: aldehyde dehydrogenase family protein [Chromatiales bacterium]|jgi:acyl-CoA reductase-like NAD-dependent aldehyde dehydrogenase
MTTTADWWERAAIIQPEVRAFINGAYRELSPGQRIVRNSPVDGRSLPVIHGGGEQDVDAAVTAARKSFADGRWHRLPPVERKQILLDFAELLQQHAQQLALLDTLSMGKAINNCLATDIPLALRCYAWFAEAIDKLYDESLPMQPDSLGFVTREPLGVVAAISPWNYPVENVAWKLAPALAAGNSVVLKPAEQASYSALLLGGLAQQAGIPDGVLNILPGPGEITGKALALHNDVDGVFFTGSTEVGKLMQQYAGRSNMKRVALETGGKSAFVLLQGYGDLPLAARTLAQHMFSNQGQTCSAPSRLIIDNRLYEQFMPLLLEATQQWQPGDPLNPQTNVGALVSHDDLSRIEANLQAAQEQGARLLTGGERVEPVRGGAYLQPTIFDRVDNAMHIAQEEIFGPVLSVILAENAEDALAKANDSRYGLAAAVWTDDISLAHQFARRLRVGSVYINNYGGGDITAPFGGYKQSGNGSKDKSLYALDDYMHSKTTWLQLQSW